MATARNFRFDVHPSVCMMETWVRTLPEKTGRSLEEWLMFIRKEGPKAEAEARAWLKDRHKLGTNSAWWLAERAFAEDLRLMDDTPESYLALAPTYVSGQYAGKKADLKPIFDRLYALARSIGKDVKVCPCKTIVPLYREHVFAEIKATTNNRVDLGLCLTPLLKGGKSVPQRLIDTGGYAKKNRITHRIPLSSPDQVDEFCERWARRAYELDQPAG